MERRCDRLCSYSLRALVLACRGRGASPRYPDARLPGGSAGADEKPLTRGLRLAIASATRGFGGQATAMPARRGEIARERLQHLAVSALTSLTPPPAAERVMRYENEMGHQYRRRTTRRGSRDRMVRLAKRSDCHAIPDGSSEEG